MAVVEGDPAPDAGPGLRTGFTGQYVDGFRLQGAPETLDEDVVEAASLAVYQYPVPTRLSRSV